MIEIYQIKARIKKISPAIWRRILIRNDSTLADLHYTLQIAFGWTDFYLHQFIIHGKRYGISRACGIYFSDNPKEIQLKSFKFRLKEKFLYEYNFNVNWETEIRIEKFFFMDPKKSYPLCIEGKRCGPPEDCGGPWAYMEHKGKYSLWYVEDRLLEMIKNDEINYCLDEINEFKYWLSTEKFNRQSANHRLKQYSQGLDDWMYDFEEV